MWARALFDMSAFVLVAGGDPRVREMQQWLNLKFYTYFGILSCDGIYQRDTNTALIYALQSAEGMSPEQANGFYGEQTTALTPTLTPTLKESDSGIFVTILQYALYVNGFYLNGSFDGIFGPSVGDAVEQFKQFMILQPYNRIADMPVMKGLLSSAGDTNRWATGADTSTQLTPTQIQTLVEEDVHIIGRYLTGTVGTGSDKRDKFLTIEELTNLFAQNISVFPIYQDGGWDITYFTYKQGGIDGGIALSTAKDLNIPEYTTIYFAVDVDIQGEDIPGTVIQYFRGVNESLSQSSFKIGVYGTRNVCNQVINQGLAIFAFVSDMSTGFSGNLGFPMPRRWAFDQFIEFTIGSGDGAVGIDNVAVSGLDNGFSSFDSGDASYIDRIEHNKQMWNQMYQASIDLPEYPLENIINPHLTLYRYTEYSGTAWDFLAGGVGNDKTIYDEYKANLASAGTPLYTFVYDPDSGRKIDLAHLIVTLQTHLFNLAPVVKTTTDFAGWLGDLITCWNDAKISGTSEDDIEEYMYNAIGEEEVGTFPAVDLIQDIDAYNVDQICQVLNDQTGLNGFLKYYTQNGWRGRVSQFTTVRFGNVNNIYNITYDAVTTDQFWEVVNNGILTFFVQHFTKYSISDFLKNSEAIAKAFERKMRYFNEHGLD